MKEIWIINQFANFCFGTLLQNVVQHFENAAARFAFERSGLGFEFHGDELPKALLDAACHASAMRRRVWPPRENTVVWVGGMAEPSNLKKPWVEVKMI